MKNEKLTLALRINATMWLMHQFCPIQIYRLDRISREFLREWWNDITSMCWHNSEKNDWAPLHIPTWVPEVAKKVAANWRSLN